MSNTKHIEQMFEKYYKKPFGEITENDIVNSFSKVIVNPEDEELEDYVDKRLKEYSIKLADKLMEYPVMEMAFERYDGIVEFMGLSKEEADAVIDKFNFKERYKEIYRKAQVSETCMIAYRINKYCKDENEKAELLELIFNKNEEVGKEWLQNIDKHIILELIANDFRKWEIMLHIDYMTEEIYEANKPSQEEICEYKSVIQCKEPTDEDAEEAYKEYLSKKGKAE